MAVPGRAAPDPVARERHGVWGDQIFRGLVFAVAASVVATLGLFLYVLLAGSSLSFRAFGSGFLSGSTWDVPAQQFGALPLIYGTGITSVIALLIGVPISLGIAIFLTELSPRWLRTPLTFVVELLAAVPSVVYGLWAFFILVPLMGHSIEPSLQSVIFWHSGSFAPLFFLQGLFSGTPIGTDKLTAGLILSVMIIPTVSAVSREAFAQVPQNQREAALSLGATQWETTRYAVVSYARTGIFGASILGLGRAIGETMAVTMTIGNLPEITSSLLQSGQTIPSEIANSWAEAIPGTVQQSALLEIALILLGIALVINIAARLLIGRLVGGGRDRE